MDDIYAIVLAAGKGTRMKSKLSKVLHPICGQPMIEYVLEAARSVKCQDIFVVIGHEAQAIEEALGSDLTYVHQKEQLGTGHAVMVARENLKNKKGRTFVLCGDTPLVSEYTLQDLLHTHQELKAAVTILTTEVDRPQGYGRIVRNEGGHVERIVEQKDATTSEQKIREINAGIYCFENEDLLYALNEITNDNAQEEYYLTDCIEVLKKNDKQVAAHLTKDSEDTLGVNDRVALAQAEKWMRKRINEQHMLQGVTIIDPDQTYIEPHVHIGYDTVIYPGTHIGSHTTIGEDCRIGPQTEVTESTLGNRCHVQYSKVIQSNMNDDISIGPYSFVRPGNEIGRESKVGSFVEIKNSTVKSQTKIPHLSYIGDADLGSKVNIGCGAITVNYDGMTKSRTRIEDDSFIGCNVNLISPVTVGRGAYIAAGSTITDSVPEESLAIARARQTVKEQYALKLRSKNKNDNKG